VRFTRLDHLIDEFRHRKAPPPCLLASGYFTRPTSLNW